MGSDPIVSMFVKKLCYWAVFPNTHQTALVEAMRDVGIDVSVCYFRDYDRYRKALGWKERPLAKWEHRVGGVCDAKRQIPDFNERVQVVGAFFNLTYWKLMTYCIIRKIPWMGITERSSGSWKTRPLLHLFAKLVTWHAERLQCIGQTACEQFRSLGVPESKLVWTSYATPLAPFHSPELDESRPIVFVYAGAFTHRKATDILAEAWKFVHSRHPNTRLVAIGAGQPEYRKLLEDAGDVEFLGMKTQEDAPRFIAQGDVIVLPSRYDPWGMTLMEGAAMGLAMIGSNHVEAAKDMIVDGVNGFRVEAGSVDSLADAMCKYAEDRKLLAAHKSAARKSIEKTYPKACAKRFVDS